MTTGASKAPGWLALVVVVQAVAAVAFVGDVVIDWIEDGLTMHSGLEAVVAVALVLGLATGIIAARRAIVVVQDQTTALRTASGALVDVVAEQFRAWGLTPAEADVAMLALKGLGVAEIAAMRGAAQGTVRAQLTRIYAKAGVAGRPQFAAWFVEDLLGEGVRPPTVTPAT